jgi:isoaspartyl peptidase/L-asparaginase-like protein (Ntn-hydrolase superfamily)
VELDDQDQYFVGVGGLPNAEGKMEFDAAIMDHNRRYGAVSTCTRTLRTLFHSNIVLNAISMRDTLGCVCHVL